MIGRLCLALAVTLFSHDAAFALTIPGLSGEQSFKLIVAAAILAGIALGGWSLYSAWQNLKRAKASALWPTVGGTIVASEMRLRLRHNKKKRATKYYTPHVRYAYKVTGTDYVSETIRFGDLERWHRFLADRLTAKYPEGATVAVRYDPHDPSCATLETKSAVGREIWTGLFLIVVPLIMAIILFFLPGKKPDLPPEVLERLEQPS